jgi:hypothetical protein
VWHFRRHYSAINSDLLEQINSVNYQFSPRQKIIKHDGKIIHLWGVSMSIGLAKALAREMRGTAPKLLGNSIIQA